MSKYKVEVGGFVNTFNRTEDGFVDRFRHRTLVVYAKDEEEAKEKAELKFIDLCQRKPGNMCDEGIIDSIELIK
jgi:hypothetical protein